MMDDESGLVLCLHLCAKQVMSCGREYISEPVTDSITHVCVCVCVCVCVFNATCNSCCCMVSLAPCERPNNFAWRTLTSSNRKSIRDSFISRVECREGSHECAHLGDAFMHVALDQVDCCCTRAIKKHTTHLEILSMSLRVSGHTETAKADDCV